MQEAPRSNVWFVRSRALPWTRTPVSRQGWLVILAAFIALTAIGAGTGVAAAAWPEDRTMIIASGALLFIAAVWIIARTISRHTGSAKAG